MQTQTATEAVRACINRGIAICQENPDDKKLTVACQHLQDARRKLNT